MKLQYNKIQTNQPQFVTQEGLKTTYSRPRRCLHMGQEYNFNDVTKCKAWI